MNIAEGIKVEERKELRLCIPWKTQKEQMCAGGYTDFMKCAVRMRRPRLSTWSQRLKHLHSKNAETGTFVICLGRNYHEK